MENICFEYLVSVGWISLIFFSGQLALRSHQFLLWIFGYIMSVLWTNIICWIWFRTKWLFHKFYIFYKNILPMWSQKVKLLLLNFVTPYFYIKTRYLILFIIILFLSLSSKILITLYSLFSSWTNNQIFYKAHKTGL